MGSNGNIHPQRLHRFLTIMPCTIRNQAGMRGLIAAGSFNGGFLSGVGDFFKKIAGKLASLQLANTDKMTRRDGSDGFLGKLFLNCPFYWDFLTLPMEMPRLWGHFQSINVFTWFLPGRPGQATGPARVFSGDSSKIGFFPREIDEMFFVCCSRKRLLKIRFCWFFFRNCPNFAR